MDNAERDRLEQERDRLVLAESDMRQVAAAAAYLAKVRMNGDAERTLWTGLVVTYARPYNTKNRLGAIKGRLARPEDHGLRELHRNLCERRDDVFAHNDATDLRNVVDAYAMLGMGGGSFTEQYAPMSVEVLPAIGGLAQAQEARFHARRAAVEAQLLGPTE